MADCGGARATALEKVQPPTADISSGISLVDDRVATANPRPPCPGRCGSCLPRRDGGGGSEWAAATQSATRNWSGTGSRGALQRRFARVPVGIMGVNVKPGLRRRRQKGSHSGNHGVLPQRHGRMPPCTTDRLCFSCRGRTAGMRQTVGYWKPVPDVKASRMWRVGPNVGILVCCRISPRTPSDSVRCASHHLERKLSVPHPDTEEPAIGSALLSSLCGYFVSLQDLKSVKRRKYLIIRARVFG
ncbi:hypothetical protein QBC42DRAFT_254414 [Cladorrhinum samala]|uniref:Uncharacterized protein n=1 Tax=Cladorrhinum samala TaxID=585594 RepID=A0AAV9HHU2_9PEZI|nr:hypothetical protein QBC42DRAFT_254414 [Cladorrhinum samala]